MRSLPGLLLYEATLMQRRGQDGRMLEPNEQTMSERLALSRDPVLLKTYLTMMSRGLLLHDTSHRHMIIRTVGILTQNQANI